jgi:hypothetical protein
MHLSRHKKLQDPVMLSAAMLWLGTGCPGWPNWVDLPNPGAPVPTAGSKSSDAGQTSGAVSQPILPTYSGECPKLDAGDLSWLGLKGRLWVGEAPSGRARPLLVYWHGTGSVDSEVETMLSDELKDILSQGGIVLSMQDSTGTGSDLGFGTWYTGDFAIADEFVACAAAQYDVDPQRIYTAGCSAGGLAAAGLANGRSNYIAAAMPNSGGTVLDIPLQDPARAPAVITAHGPADQDVVIVSFAETSLNYDRTLVMRGGFAVDCEHTGGHCGAPPELKRAQWQFLQAHTYGVSPEPYADGLPADFPSYCQIIRD